ncbi:c-type cytochrome domain-containing protein [Novipirellula artificiosorum]|uniref:Planctomycete cytochrome C n=1 Tax=Novipirellula artificiosorum TaxID=2528016 RepID=A0A5C6DVM9_9BACT|nr:c-type cytochrome domain-containing protein [Novipirellula artificiosorum]TWU40678.1 Planctomycete cytochrome C [Novipirellula artificiosorum]
MRLFLFLLFLLSLSCCCDSVKGQESGLTPQQRKMAIAINESLGEAGRHYQAGNLKAAADAMRVALDELDAATQEGSQVMIDSLDPIIKRLRTAHLILELEGASMPPFVWPSPSTDTIQTSVANPLPAKPVAPSPPTATVTTGPISFIGQVAPILIRHCGRCHVTGSRGDFSMSTYATLIKGSPAGVVVFAGDVPNSVLIENIESGSMPPSGQSLPAEELQTLKDWIALGAKFDGDDPNTPLSSLASGSPSPQQPTLEIKRATGEETVRFAAEVAPLLVESCKGCHLDAMQTRGGLSLDTFAQLMRGGDSGPILVPGNAADSLLIQKLRGMSGDRMPAGGRPPLADQAIEMISTWIDEGARLDAADAGQPLEVMSQLAWVANATATQVSEKRKQQSRRDLQLIDAAQEAPPQTETEHFLVTGNASDKTIEWVAKLAEQQWKLTKTIVPGGKGEDYYHGRATIFVMPRRYDYSEFCKMIEQRDVPADWNRHWKFDGLGAYVVVVAADDDDDQTVASRLTAPLVSLAVATRGSDIPRWFAEGVGTNVALANAGKVDRATLQRQQQETIAAVAAMENAKQFLEQQLKPEQTDRIGAAITSTMMDRTRRKNFDSLLRMLDTGTPFEQAFLKAANTTPAEYVTAWLAWVKR